MNDLQATLVGLQSTLPLLTPDEFLALEEPSAEFEAHVPAETGEDFWIYSVCGKTFNGELMVIRAPKFMPGLAETRAQDGLAETIAAYKRYQDNTGLQATVEVRGLE